MAPLLLGCFAVLMTIQGQAVPETRPISAEALKAIPAKLDQLKGIVGDWEGEGFGGQIDEHWLPANGDGMPGLFRLTVEGKLRSISVLNLRQVGEIVHMILRGVSPELTGDTSPNTMVLVELNKDRARFVNRFEGALPKALIVTHPKGGLQVVVESEQNGTPTRTELNFRRARKG